MMALGSLLGSIAGGFLGGPTGAAIGGGLGSLFGGKKKQPGYQQQVTQQQGFNTLPEPVRNAYLQQYLPGILSQYQGKYQGLPMGQAPTGPFASQGLQELQNYSNQIGGIFAGGTGVNPLGQVEPFNPYQQQALQSLGGGIGALGNELSQYMNPYQKFVQDEINRQHSIAQNNALSDFSRAAGFGGLQSSAYGTLQSQLEQNRLRDQNQAQVQNYQQALGLRRQTLADMLGAGGQIQQQGQNMLGALQPQLQQTLPQARTGLLGQQLGAFQGSPIGYNYQQMAPKQTAEERIFGGLQTGIGYGKGLNKEKSENPSLSNLLSFFG